MSHVTMVPHVSPGELAQIRVDGRLVVAKVVKVMRVKFLATTEDGKQYECRITSFKPAPEGSVFNEPEAPELELHTHVRFKRGSRGAAQCPGLLFTVARAGALNSWKCAIVGTSRYYREIPAAELEPVKVEIVV